MERHNSKSYSCLLKTLTQLRDEMMLAVNLGGRDGNYTSKKWLENRIRRATKAIAKAEGK